MKSLVHKLIAARAELDANLPGLGLYSSCEYQAKAYRPHPPWKIESKMALCPRLESLGCRWKQSFERRKGRAFIPKFGSGRFMTSSRLICDLHMIRASFLKVRRFGSGFQMDRNIDYSDRWAQLKMDQQIRQLWWPDRCKARADIRILLFLRFDQAKRPFHAELTMLEKQTRWQEHQVKFISKCWPDSASRGFNVLAGCWSSEKIQL